MLFHYLLSIQLPLIYESLHILHRVQSDRRLGVDVIYKRGTRDTFCKRYVPHFSRLFSAQSQRLHCCNSAVNVNCNSSSQPSVFDLNLTLDSFRRKNQKNVKMPKRLPMQPMCDFVQTCMLYFQAVPIIL